MPKNKKLEDSSSDSDSGPDDREPPKMSKKSDKPEKRRNSTSDSDTGKKAPAKKSKSSDDDEDSWTIGKLRFLKLREFRGRWSVDIREWYDSNGELKPGKKGISLSMDQWQKLKSIIEDVDEAIKRRV